MRSIPGMTVLCPADDVEAKAAVKAAYEHEGPVYLRFGRLALPVFHDEATFKFEIGKGEQLTEGSDVAIIATAERPFKGAKGCYRVNLKHAISRVREGERIGLELSFHDAP